MKVEIMLALNELDKHLKSLNEIQEITFLRYLSECLEIKKQLVNDEIAKREELKKSNEKEY